MSFARHRNRTALRSDLRQIDVGCESGEVLHNLDLQHPEGQTVRSRRYSHHTTTITSAHPTLLESFFFMNGFRSLMTLDVKKLGFAAMMCLTRAG